MITFETYQRIHQALEMISSGALDELDLGRHDLGPGIYVNVVEIQTKDSGIFESHRQYVDIHYPISGAERIELADEAGMEVTEAYDEEKDCVFGNASGERYSYIVKPKTPFVVMPGEAHVPGLSVSEGERQRMKKAVVKVLV